MQETFSQDFKRIFLLTFTKELIIHSAKKEMTKLPKSYIIELFRHKVRELEIELKSAKKASSLFASK